MTDYRPIACADYERLELAILHRQRLRVRWTEAVTEHLEYVQPVDLLTQNGDEFLVFRDTADMEHRVRLDHLRVL